ncbi:MAG: hypothetical protein CFE24_12680 [Flavobacterium sp. BFFFF2]|nr:MAG: hypothetical protein CFE24_12680 [Flavobacterium sp. BFFFF2]
MKKLLLLTLLTGFWAKAQTVSFADPLLKHILITGNVQSSGAVVLTNLSGNTIPSIDLNGNGNIDLNEIQNIKTLNIFASSPEISLATFEDFNLFTNLEELKISKFKSNSPLVASNIPALKKLNIDNVKFIVDCSNSQTLEEFISFNPGFDFFKYNNSQIVSFDNCNHLKILNLGENFLYSYYFNTECPDTNVLNSNTNAPIVGSPLDLSTLTELEILIDSYYRLISFMNLSSCHNLKKLQLYGKNNHGSGPNYTHDYVLNELSNMPQLEYLNLGNNHFTTLNLSQNHQLKGLAVLQNSIPQLDFVSMPLLEILCVDFGELNNPPLPNLKEFYFYSNTPSVYPFHTFTAALYPFLSTLTLANTSITQLDFSTNTLLKAIEVNNYLQNQTNSNLQTLILPDAPSILNNITIRNTSLIQIDFSACPQISTLQVSDNSSLKYINIKNGQFDSCYESIADNPLLTSACTDEGETLVNIIHNIETGTSIENHINNPFCNPVPGGPHNTLKGVLTFDVNGNGCDANDPHSSFSKVLISNGTESGVAYAAPDGSYTYYVPAGNYTLTPQLPNSAWYQSSPATSTVAFADNNNHTETRSFCVAANGVHPEVEVVLYALSHPRPGFDNTYQATIINHGNQISAGSLAVSFDDARQDYVACTPVSSVSPGLVTWNFTNLQPFESRDFQFTVNVNSPVETPAVNINDELPFTASVVLTGATDEVPDNNTFSYSSQVMGSFDPNETVCLEGPYEPVAQVGNYLHYQMHFENTGNSAAEFINIDSAFDPAQYDVNSIQLLNTSHPAEITLKNNHLLVYFPQINLGPQAQGSVLFKVKTKSTLTQNASVTRNANIYFDYNAPVTTNTATTTFVSLSNQVITRDESIVMAPNPVKSSTTVSASSSIRSMSVYDAQGRLLQVIKADSPSATLDVSNRSTGIYFVKVTTDLGSQVLKLSKE